MMGRKEDLDMLASALQRAKATLGEKFNKVLGWSAGAIALWALSPIFKAASLGTYLGVLCLVVAVGYYVDYIKTRRFLQGLTGLFCASCGADVHHLSNATHCPECGWRIGVFRN